MFVLPVYCTTEPTKLNEVERSWWRLLQNDQRRLNDNYTHALIEKIMFLTFWKHLVSVPFIVQLSAGSAILISTTKPHKIPPSLPESLPLSLATDVFQSSSSGQAASTFGFLSSTASPSACARHFAFFLCFGTLSLISSHCDSFFESCLFLFLPCSEPGYHICN